MKIPPPYHVLANLSPNQSMFLGLVESFDAFDEFSLVAYPDGVKKSIRTLPFPTRQVVAQGLRILSIDSPLQRSDMLATILIVVMILLQTGALSLGLMVGRRFVIEAASLNRKSALFRDGLPTYLKNQRP
jgi:hypothetical protein